MVCEPELLATSRKRLSSESSVSEGESNASPKQPRVRSPTAYCRNIVFDGMFADGTFICRAALDHPPHSASMCHVVTTHILVHCCGWSLIGASLSPHTDPSQVPNLRPRALATLKKLVAQHEKKQTLPLFAWGRMTLTIRPVSASDTDPVLELWKPRRHEIVAVLAYIHMGHAADLLAELVYDDYEVCKFLCFCFTPLLTLLLAAWPSFVHMYCMNAFVLTTRPTCGHLLRSSFSTTSLTSVTKRD